MHSLLMNGEIAHVEVFFKHTAHIPHTHSHTYAPVYSHACSSHTHPHTRTHPHHPSYTSLSHPHSPPHHPSYTSLSHPHHPSYTSLSHPHSYPHHPSYTSLSHPHSPPHHTLATLSHSLVWCRGRCQVHEVDGTSSINHYLDMENTFFYCLGYTPETRWAGQGCIVCVFVCLCAPGGPFNLNCGICAI